ncbi:MAG TPA: aminoacyl-tRNA hydrolase [Spirochaetota bacterium]|nr:aminoacyl-tRNA hydrolase [Spirochaetota bacterium]
MQTKLIVGIGNPGEEYKHTRHNFGFMCVDYLTKAFNIPYRFEKKKAIFGKKKLQGTEVILLKPQTFSNLSGEAVLYIASFLKVHIKDILVLYDDIRLKLGDVKIEQNIDKIEHNAIHNLEKALVSDNEFVKCGLGIGPLPRNKDLDDFYLSEFTSREKTKFKETYKKLFVIAAKFLNIEIKKK